MHSEKGISEKLSLEGADSEQSNGRRPAALSLARKLWLALCGLVIITGLCGAAALSVFYRIEGSVSVLSEVATPLLIESIALKSNADRMRSVLLDLPDDESAGEAQLADIARLDEEGRRHAAKLELLAGSLRLEGRFEVIHQLQNNFRSALEDMVHAQAGKAKANEAVATVFGEIHAATEAAEAGLAAITPMPGIADGFDLEADRALHAFAPVHDLAAEIFLIDSALDLENFKRSSEAAIRDLGAIVESLGTLSSRGGRESDFRQVADAFASLRSHFFDPKEGIVAKEAERLEHIGIFNARSKKLGQVLAGYNDVLAGVEKAVRNETERSRSQAASVISQGLAAVAGLVVLSVLVAIGAAIFLTRSISRPLERLTGHLQRMQGGSDLPEISDPALLNASDELGQLSRAFNRMIGELAAARKDLIATSEAEIGKQVQRLEAAIGNMSQGLCMFDSEQRLIINNARYAEIYGIPADQIYPGMPLREILELRLVNGGYHGDAHSYLTRRLTVPRDNKPAHSVIELANGRTLQIVRHPLNEGGWVSTHEDITDRRQIEAKIAHMAHHDVLTNLPNRALFNTKMEESLARVARGETIAVFHMDIDHFKTINDTLGHAIGDAVLREVTDRLLGCVREIDMIARLGGDEFAIIQTAVEHPDDVTALAQRIVEAVSEPLTIEGHDVVVGTSIGIALAPGDGSNGEELLQNADLALYRAKAEGRGTYRLFERAMDAKMRERRALELDMRNALAHGQFELFYQPLVSVGTGRIVCFEALLRWHHPERGLVSPADFIPLAEENGLIVPIGEWAINDACREAVKWPAAVHVAVNVSPVQFKSPNLVSTIAQALAKSGLPPARLDVEITESVLLSENASVLDTLKQIKALGVRIAMDDFGTGYSSLSYLRSFPFDKIKIDRSFIRDITSSKDCVAIVKAVTDLGTSLGMATIAEGVETEEQLKELRLQGCDAIQGYLISRPRPAEELKPLLDELSDDAAA